MSDLNWTIHYENLNMMGHRERLVGGTEYDMFTGWRKVIFCDKGRSHRTKQTFNRRIRRAAKQKNLLEQL